MGVHFGSRGLGHKTATYFLNEGGAKDGMDVDPLVLDVRSSLGGDYLACMTLAGRYAYAGRDWVCAEVARILGAKIREEVHNHHNFCIPGTEKIPMPSGFKRMRDVAAGDMVYAFDEQKGLVKTKVLDAWHTGRKAIYTIRTQNREMRVSATHPVLTISVTTHPHPERPWFNKGRGEYRWVQASDIKEGDIVVCADGYYDQGRSIGEDMARFIGAYLGDGWLRHSDTLRSGYGVGLAIGTYEEAHTERYQALCQTLFPQVKWSNNAPGAFGLTCSSREVHRTVTELGIGLRSDQKQVPYFVYELPLNEKLAFLAGYFDSDGSVASQTTSNYGRGSICTVSQELCEGVREVAISCGLQITPVRRGDVETNFGPSTIYRCVISTGSMKALDLWHEGKAGKLRATMYGKSQGLEAPKIGYLDLPDGIFAQRVRSISVSEHEEDVYDLTVAHESHSFVCEGIVVHNCWRETHNGRDLWVVRKGATPAFPGQKGFVGGSMGDISVILEGVESDEGREALYSTVHGAGRVMSRTAARGKINRKTGQVISPGAVSREMMLDWIKKQGVELRGAGTDESPHCYKRIEEVLGYHAKSIRILHTLTPLGVAMAGESEVDPYKD